MLYNKKDILLHRDLKQIDFQTILKHVSIMKATSKTWIETANSRVNALNEGIIDTTSVAVKSYKVGNQYRYFAHTFAIWAKGSFRNDVSGKVSNHVVFAVTFDGKDDEHYLDSEGIKQRIGDERRIERNYTMDTSGKAVKSKRIETAANIEAKYAKAIEAINNAVAKLNNSDNTADLLHSLIDSLNADCNTQVEAINNAALAAHLQRVERIERYSSVLPNMQLDAVQAMQDGNFDRAIELGKAVKEMQAELLLLQQEEAAYQASIENVPTEEAEVEAEA